MTNARVTLPDDFRELRELVDSNPNSEPMLKALAALAKAAPDQSLIVHSFAGLDPENYGQPLRHQIADMLRDSEAPEAAQIWDAPKATNTNVVPMMPGATPLSSTPSTRETVSFDNVGGLEPLKAQMRRKIIKPFKNEGLFKKFKRRAGGGILMYGPPGCGKTMLARALANECDATFHNVTAAHVLDPFVGTAEKRIAKLFEDARASRPVVLFFDEVEALAQKRQMQSTEKVNTVVSALLNEMDGFATDNEGVLLLGATNVPWSLDGAFRRPGRFDRTLFVPPPDKVARRFILQSELQDRPVDPAISLDPVIKATSGYSGADLGALVETAVDYAIEDSEGLDDLCPINNSHLNEALREVRATTGEWLAQAQPMIEYANRDGLYNDLADFLRSHGR